MSAPNPGPLCLLRLSALGDVTHVLPVVHSLQAHWPGRALHWVIGKLEHKLVGALPGVRFHVYDKRGGRVARRQLTREVAEALHGGHFEDLLLMQLSLRANLLSRALPAQARWGYDRARAKEGHGLFINRRIPAHPDGHVAQTLMQFATALGATPRWDWSLPEAPADAQWAREAAPGDAPYVVISPCSSHERRNWHVEGYAQLADHLSAQHGLRVLLCGGPSALEREVAAAIAARMRQPSLNLVGQDTLPQFLALLRRARLLVSPDSGPAHFGTVAGIPVLGLYAATDPQRSGPFHWRDYAANAYPEAARRYRGREAGELRWGHKIEEAGVMDLLQPQAVIAAADRLLADTAA